MKKKELTLRSFIVLTTATFTLLGCAMHFVLPHNAGASVERSQASTTETTQTTTERTTLPTTTKAPPAPCEVELIPDTIWGEVVTLLGRTIWGEAEGVQDKAEQAAVAWCILNRVDATGQTIEEVVTAPGQFHGFYRVEGEVPREFLDLAADVLNRWNLEKQGTEDVGRVLPADYLYFVGDGARNYFSKEWQSSDYWGWTLKSPY